MERPTSGIAGRGRTAEGDVYEVEAQLADAEQRYVQARDRSRKARDECHALEAEQDSRADMVKAARQRFEAAEAKCTRLRQLIVELEERLE